MGQNIIEPTLRIDQLALGREKLELERDQANAKVDGPIGILKEITEGRIEIEKTLQSYDNPHAPPSNKTITQREIDKAKGEERRRGNPGGRRGRKKGFRGKAASRRAVQAVRHRSKKCSSCGGGNLKTVPASTGNVTDVPVLPKAIVAKHVIEPCECLDCHAVTVPKTGLFDGTSLGLNLLKIAVGLWKGRASYADIAGTLSDLFGVEGCAKSAVQHALGSAANAMEPEAGSIKAETDAKKTPVNIDETPHPIQGGTGQGWVATDRGSTVVVIAGSRGAAALMEYFPYHDRPVTADGHAAYKTFKIRQRCWARIIRESDRRVRAVRKGTGISQTDCRDAGTLHGRLKQPYREAKPMEGATERQCDALVKRLPEIAKPYPAGLAGKIPSAAGNLFTLLRYEGMEPTNNAAEREIRSVVLHRKVRGQIGSEGGMRRFGILLTCILTWRRRKLNFYQELERVLMAQA